jgi:hypothetical protein
VDRYNKYQAEQYTHTLHTHKLVVSTWLGDHQGRPSAPTIRPSNVYIWNINKYV